MASCTLKLGMVHTIRRSNIFQDVMALYTTKDQAVINEHPFRVRLYGERGVDTGGVTREMFSVFFEQMYIQLFDGSCLLYPAVHASMDMSNFIVLGTILSHACRNSS